MHKPFTWKKLGRIFNPEDYNNRFFLKEFAQAPCAILFDGFVRVYFSCRPEKDTNGSYVSYTAFADFEKNNLFNVIRVSESPILQLGSLGTFDEFGTYPVSVVKHDDKLIAYYGGWTRCYSVPFNVSIGMAISENNGETFTKVGPGPILSFSKDEPFILSGPKIRYFNNKFYLFYIAGKKWILDNGKPEPVYRIRLATSEDGYTWHKLERDIIDVKLEEDEAQASPDVFFMNGIYHMVFCYRRSKDYRNAEGGYRMGYAYSLDLLNWTREDSYCGMDVSKEGWDSESISYPHIFSIEQNTYMLYLGNQVGKYGFGLAQMA